MLLHERPDRRDSRPRPGVRVALLALAAVAATCGSAGADQLVPAGTYIWNEGRADFGGFSGLAVYSRGARFVTVSDQGAIYDVSVTRGADGKITAIASHWTGRPLDNKGDEVAGFHADAEAVARAKDGSLYIAFESYTRIARFRLPDLTPHPLHTWERFRTLWGNKSLESLALRPDGVLLGVIEKPVAGGAEYRTIIGTENDWQSGPPIPTRGGYKAVDAVFGGDGQLWLLERDFSWLGDYRTRIRRFSQVRDGWSEADTVLDTGWGELDNMEGMSLWQDGNGRTMVTLISDDNFLGLQETLVAEYVLEK